MRNVTEIGLNHVVFKAAITKWRKNILVTGLNLRNVKTCLKNMRTNKRMKKTVSKEKDKKKRQWNGQ